MSAREVDEMKNAGKIKTEPPKHETYEWISKKTGAVHDVPKGIDPGWDYNVGMTQRKHGTG